MYLKKISTINWEKKIELRKIFTQISSENTDQIFLVIFLDKALKVEKIGSSFLAIRKNG